MPAAVASSTGAESGRRGAFSRFTHALAAITASKTTPGAREKLRGTLDSRLPLCLPHGDIDASTATDHSDTDPLPPPGTTICNRYSAVVCAYLTALTRPALAPSASSCSKRIVPPWEPPVFEILSYVPEACQANLRTNCRVHAGAIHRRSTHTARTRGMQYCRHNSSQQVVGAMRCSPAATDKHEHRCWRAGRALDVNASKHTRLTEDTYTRGDHTQQHTDST